MKRSKKLILVLAALGMFAGETFAKEITTSIIPGKMWSERAPQCAVWIEDENGIFVDTIYVTKSAAKKGWKFSPKEGRPDSLPAWYGAAGINPAAPTVKNFDAVASATPKKSITVTSNLNLQTGKKYIVKAEVNQSFDYNEFWTKKNSGVNGQPSLIYSGEFVAGGKLAANDSEIVLTLQGHGDLEGKSKKIFTTEMEKITTAIQIIGKVVVAF